IPYAMMGLDNPKPMLLPTPDWFQAMRTFVLSLEMRAGAPPSPAGFQPVQASSADPGAGNRPGKPNGNTATPAAGHPIVRVSGPRGADRQGSARCVLARDDELQVLGPIRTPTVQPDERTRCVAPRHSRPSNCRD